MGGWVGHIPLYSLGKKPSQLAVCNWLCAIGCMQLVVCTQLCAVGRSSRSGGDGEQTEAVDAHSRG